MRLVTYDAGAGARLGAVLDGRIVDLAAAHLARCRARGASPSDAANWLTDMIAYLTGGPPAAAAAEAALEFAAGRFDQGYLALEREQVRLLAPIPVPQHVIMIGINYVSHAKEYSLKMPEVPWVSAKFSTNVIGPGAPVVRHRLTHKMNGEVELAVIIGRPGRYIAPGDTLRHVAGWSVLNDVSARDFKFVCTKGQRQFTLGKNGDTFLPLGPELVTVSELPDPYGLEVSQTVNGDLVQRANTRDLYMKIPRILSFISQYFTLQPGDVISTGTCEFLKERHYEPGDEVTVRVEHVGSLTNPIVGP